MNRDRLVRLADLDRMTSLPRDLPLYIAVGDNDPVNGGLTLLWPLVDRFRTAGLEDVTVRVYEGGRHEIFNDTDRTQVIGDLVQWLQRVSTKQRTHHG